MVQFTINTHRFDPYKAFKFRLKWEGRYVAGISKVSALKTSTEPIKFREGNDPKIQRLMPGHQSYEAVTLERGVTHDTEFEDWAKLVYSTDGDSSISLKNFRHDVTIEFMNEAGQIAKVYNLFDCWVSEYTALPELDANSTNVAIESMVLQNTGWARDLSVTEPTET
ncbi:MAG: phage tail protein [Sulfitobacter sp.]|uniref:phage tail protein n=1 Tax=Sulfitobacter sp. TaxID=1903071 RepID=UPI0032999D33